MGFREKRLTLRTICFAALVVGLTLLFSGVTDAAEISGTVDNILDGDTFDVGAVRIRLHGIDAAEQGQRCPAKDGGDWRCGASGRNALVDIAEGEEVSCQALDRDKIGRIIARCGTTVVGDISAALVSSGMAWAFERYSSDYVATELAAREAGLGIWQSDTRPVPPWDYRANKWDRAADASPRTGCPIKGNIRNGEKIYHTPWSPNYEQTVIDTAAGEKWFCNENEAIEAGWRAPRN